MASRVTAAAHTPRPRLFAGPAAALGPRPLPGGPVLGAHGWPDAVRWRGPQVRTPPPPQPPLRTAFLGTFSSRGPGEGKARGDQPSRCMAGGAPFPAHTAGRKSGSRRPGPRCGGGAGNPNGGGSGRTHKRASLSFLIGWVWAGGGVSPGALMGPVRVGHAPPGVCGALALLRTCLIGSVWGQSPCCCLVTAPDSAAPRLRPSCRSWRGGSLLWVLLWDLSRGAVSRGVFVRRNPVQRPEEPPAQDYNLKRLWLT